MGKAKKITIVLFVVLFAFVGEILLSNHQFFYYGAKTVSTELSFTQTTTNENDVKQYIYDIKNIDSYVKKLKMLYEVKEKQNLNFNIKRYDEYGNIYVKEKNSDVVTEFNTSYTNYDYKIKSIKIKATKPITIKNISIENYFTFSIIRFLWIVSVALMLIYLILNRKIIGQKLHIIAMTIILISGGFMIVSTPTQASLGMDEQIHLSRSYSNSFFRTASYSKSFYYVTDPIIHSPFESAEDNKMMNQYLNSRDMNVTVNSENKSLFFKYNEIAYSFMSILIKIGRTIGLSFSNIFLLGKLGNLLFYALSCFLAIKITPIGKKLFFVLCLIPTSIFSASHYSLDAFVAGSVLVCFAMFLKMYKQEKHISNKDMLIFLFFAIIGCLSKAVYSLMLLLPLFLDSKNFINKKQMIIFKLSLVTLFIMMIISFGLPMLFGSGDGDNRGGDTSMIRQLMVILHHPLGFIEMFYRHIKTTFTQCFFSHRFINNYGYGISPSENLTTIYLVLLIFISTITGSDFKIISNKNRWIIFIATLCTICMINGAMYLSFTEVAKTFIKGVQSRYFVPILLPLIMCLTPRTITYNNEDSGINLGMCIITFIVIMLGIYQALIIAYGL